MSSHAHLSALIEAMPDAIILTNESDEIILLNRQTELLFGYKRKALLGKPLAILIPKPLPKTYENGLLSTSPTQKEQEVKRHGVKKSGKKFPVNIHLSTIKIDDEPLIVTTIRDMTKQNKVEKNLIHLAEHDPLTGLINRTLLEDRVRQGIALAKRHRCSLAVLFIDLDDFKEINDTYGHEMGDLYLCTMTQSLQQCIRDADTLARIGGDEFAIVLINLKSPTAVTRTAKKILKTFKKKTLINNKKLRLTVSIGIALYHPGDDFQSLLKKADLAMYDVKKHGKNNFKIFSMDEASEKDIV